MPWPDRFETRLSALLTGGILFLALSTSLVTSLVITRQIQKFMVTYVTQMTQQFGAHCVFAFLTEDTDVAKHSIDSIKTFPGVRYVAIVKPDHTPLVEVGNPVDWQPAKAHPTWQEGPILASQSDRYWHFLAPVQTQPVSSPYEYRVTSVERLGYVHVAWDKSLLSGVQSLITALNFFVSFIVAGLLIVWSRKQVRRLTQPLNDLARVMSRADQSEGSYALATLTGPLETREIASVFNTLMDALKRHQASLESEVAIRTLELREARDTALTASRHKSEFMAAVTHEMRTPLHSIQGYTQLVQNELAFLSETEECVNWLTVVLDSADNLLLRVNQILDFARIEAGKMDVKLSTVHLPTVINQMVEMVQPLVQKNQNQLSIKLDGTLDVNLDGDKVSQIILNLLTNAAKFTKQGTIDLNVQVCEISLIIAVKDSGIGIPSSQLPHIFEPFQQLDMSDTRKYSGTGLGLAITKNFCELLGGSCKVESQVGRGSCFRVTLPLPSSHANPPKKVLIAP